MKDLKYFNHRDSILFNDYIQDQVGLDQFIHKLRMIEAWHKQTIQDESSDKSIWFRFAHDDTQVTSIDDLQRDLLNSNRKFTLERMREAINLEQELFIQYS